MAWEVFTGGTLHPDLPSVSISSLGRFHLNKRATVQFAENDIGAIQLLFDREALVIGIRPIQSGTLEGGTYKLRYAPNFGGSRFSCVAFLNHIGYDWSSSRTFGLKWLNSLGWTFQVEPGHLGHKPQSRRIERKAKGAKETPAETGVL